MSIRASTATEKSRYANSYDILNRLRNTLDGTEESALAFNEVHRYLDEELDFYPTLSIVSDAPGIEMNFVFQITACVTFRGPGETRVVPGFADQPDNPVEPVNPVDPQEYVAEIYQPAYLSRGLGGGGNQIYVVPCVPRGALCEFVYKDNPTAIKNDDLIG